MAETVYILCALTAIVCAVLLVRSYLATRTSLLLWSSICFAGLALNNVLLYVDLVLIGPTLDLSLSRSVLALISLLFMIFGLIWHAP